MNGTLQGKRINAEFSLQNTSHNSHKNNQQQVGRKNASYERGL